MFLALSSPSRENSSSDPRDDASDATVQNVTADTADLRQLFHKLHAQANPSDERAQRKASQIMGFYNGDTAMSAALCAGGTLDYLAFPAARRAARGRERQEEWPDDVARPRKAGVRTSEEDLALALKITAEQAISGADPEKVIYDARRIAADLDKTASLDKVTSALRRAGFANLTPGALLIYIVAVLIALGLSWAFPDLPLDDQARISAASALVPFAIVISDRLKRGK